MEKVTIYTTQTCPFSRAAKTILNLHGISFEEIDVTDNIRLQIDLFQRTGFETSPLIFFDRRFIGSYEELRDMAEHGQLEKSFEKAA